MSKDQEEQKHWQEAKLWLPVRLGVRGMTPYRIYDKLSAHLKDILHKCICVPVQITTDRQREDLLRALSVSDGKDSIDSLDYMTAEERGRFLSPLSEDEKTDYLAKFR